MKVYFPIIPNEYLEKTLLLQFIICKIFLHNVYELNMKAVNDIPPLIVINL